MPTYHYKVRDKEGQDTEGEESAKDQYALAHSLRAEGLTVISIKESNTASKNSFGELPQFLQRISLEEKMNFARNISVMIGAGLSLSKALDIMSHQTRGTKFKAVIDSMSDLVRKGKAFHEALGEHPKVFPKFFQEMVRAGEKSGKLEGALQLVSIQLKKDYALGKKVKSAMVYPIIVIAAMAGIGILMLIYVVPTLIQTFKELNVVLPLSTRFVIFLSQTLVQSGFIFIIAAVSGGYGLYKFFGSETGKKTLDWIFIHAPVVHKINQKFNAARACRTLSSLISAGVDIVEALTITEGVLDNHFYKNILIDAREKIQKGDTISKAFLGNENLFPPLVGEMMAVGEETGQLSKMLLRLAMFYENEVAVATKDLSTIVEPVMMIVIGVVVGFFAISIISPMYDLVGAF